MREERGHHERVGGAPEGANSVRGARAPGAGVGERAEVGETRVSAFEVPAPPLTLRPVLKELGVPFSCRPALHRPIVFSVGYSPPDCPASPWCWTERTVRHRRRPGQESGRSRPAQVLLPTPPLLPKSGAAGSGRPSLATAPPIAAEERSALPITRGFQESPGRFQSFTTHSPRALLAKAAHLHLALDCFALFYFCCAEILILGYIKTIPTLMWKCWG